MSKVGRNDDCPCGSKLKYKRCHSSVLNSTASIESNVPLDATEQRVSLVGFPGTYLLAIASKGFGRTRIIRPPCAFWAPAGSRPPRD
ncbi:SEC-C metal-binding domain-containing protein [Tunturiibacter gelidiferens]|uniref:SEC-C metal-binding domain-containing protein n=1 Tax=Tunturiibacter gelidiferens TaxID=3069689 RepID=UPI003D9B9CFD